MCLRPTCPCCETWYRNQSLGSHVILQKPPNHDCPSELPVNPLIRIDWEEDMIRVAKLEQLDHIHPHALVVEEEEDNMYIF